LIFIAPRSVQPTTIRRWKSVKLFFVLALAPLLMGQSQADAIRAAMETSLEKQRESIRIQAARAVQVQEVPAASGFFTVAWPKRPIMASAACDPLPMQRVDELVATAASREGLKPALVREVMQHESAFKPCAISVAGAQGLMQLMPATAAQMGISDPFDPEQNVSGGAKFLKQMMDRYAGDIPRALAAYNAGPVNVDKAGGVPDFSETKAYVSQILKKLIL
jgi:soluble lytic murein transglycosylase-like protein